MTQPNNVQLFYTRGDTLYDALQIARARLQNIITEGNLITSLSQLYMRGNNDDAPVYVVFTTYVVQRDERQH